MARPKNSERLDIEAGAIDTAITIIESDGIEALTLRDIAATIGCKPPALYHYFANREALLSAVRAEGFRRFNEMKEKSRAKAGDNPVDQLREGGMAYARFARKNPELYQLMFVTGEGTIAGPEIANSLKGLAHVIERCQEKKYFPDQRAMALAFTFWSSLHGANLLTSRRGIVFKSKEGGDPVEQVVDTMMELAEATRKRR